MPSDRLTPAQLRDLADVMVRCPTSKPYEEYFREEAARREAEAKPQSAATGHYENDCEELGRTGVGQDSARPLPQGEREGPGGAADEPTYDEIGRTADSRKVIIEKLERQILRLVDERETANEKARRCALASAQWENRTRIAEKDWAEAKATHMAIRVQLAEAERELAEANATVESQAREIAELKRLANSRLEFANQYAAQLGEAEARVRELERECGQWQEASGQANVRAEQLEDKWEAEKARADKAEARVRELEAELAAERDSRQIAQATCDMQKARADGLAAAIDRAVEELDAIEKAASANDPWDELQVRAADTAKKLRMAAALTEGGA